MIANKGVTDRKVIRISILLLCICLFCTGCSLNHHSIPDGTESNEIQSEEQNNDEIASYGGENGTADTINGRTVIVSIYANDEVVTWNYDLESDRFTINDTLNNLRISTDYLTNQVEKYHKTAEFVYDWHNFSDLRYEATFKENIVDHYNSQYATQKEWIIENIDMAKIKKKYEADNVVFMYFFNTDNTNSAVTSTYNLDIDIINIFPENTEYRIPPATYAHELLHAFGAPDLYFANEVINQEYVDYYMETNPSDIMASVYYGDEITNTFSDLDAYYVGLLDECDDVTKWGLGLRKHY